MHKDAALIKYFSNAKIGLIINPKHIFYGLNISKFKTSNSKLNNNIIKSSTYSSLIQLNLLIIFIKMTQINLL